MEVFGVVEGDLQNSGYTVLEPIVVSEKDEKLEQRLKEECTDLRATTEEMIEDIFALSGQSNPAWDTQIVDPRYGSFGIRASQVGVLQAEQYASAGFARVSVELLVRDKELPQDPGDSDELHDKILKTKAEALATASTMLELHGITEPATYGDYRKAVMAGRDTSQMVKGQTQFMHTWYQPNGYLVGDIDGGSRPSRGHRDTPYGGITISRQLTDGLETVWQIGQGRDKREVIQSGRRLIVMTGAFNPFHLIETSEDQGREAVLMRLGGEQAVKFLSGVYV